MAFNSSSLVQGLIYENYKSKVLIHENCKFKVLASKKWVQNIQFLFSFFHGTWCFLRPLVASKVQNFKAWNSLNQKLEVRIIKSKYVIACWRCKDISFALFLITKWLLRPHKHWHSTYNCKADQFKTLLAIMSTLCIGHDISKCH